MKTKNNKSEEKNEWKKKLNDNERIDINKHKESFKYKRKYNINMEERNQVDCYWIFCHLCRKMFLPKICLANQIFGWNTL